jgi:hypothetical protein
MTWSLVKFESEMKRLCILLKQLILYGDSKMMRHYIIIIIIQCIPMYDKMFICK